MALMAIDHANFFIAGQHVAGEFWGVPLPTYSGAVPFLTRWVTHLAAPGFFFLLGASVTLLAAARRAAGWSEGRILRYLALRGALLVVAQQFLENPAWLFGILLKRGAAAGVVPGTSTAIMVNFGVLNALGVALFTSGLVVRLRPLLTAAFGLGAIALTLALTPGAADVARPYEWWVRLLLIPGITGIVQVFYPLLPWCGVAALGVAFGEMLRRDAPRTQRAALPLGVALVGLFLVFRLTGLGVLHGVETPGWMGFLSVTKYPPDAAFLAITLGIDLVLLGLLARWSTGPLERPLEVFGGTALFFYLLHLWLYLALGAPFRSGTGFGMLYAGWVVGLVILYFACAWYLRFKRGTSPESLWRLL